MLNSLLRQILDPLLVAYEDYAGLIALLLVLLCSTRLADRFFRAMQRIVWKGSRWPAVATLGIGLLGTAMAWGLSQVRWPEPRIHDEFTHLLIADTFSRGRVTNPPHPMWQHFESPHTIYQPTYAGKYPPGPGFVMAAGKAIGGHPVVGLWITNGLLAMAVCWMLMAWLRPPWALLGGLLVALHTQSLYWSQNFIGGGVSMLGGTLVIGGVLHIMNRPRVAPALALGLGLAILMNTRPAEGFVLCLLLAGGMLASWMSDGAPRWPELVKKIVLPVALILLPTIAGMLYYNWRVTGDALKLPYMLHAQEYSVAPNFVWQPLGEEPQYRHEELRNLHVGYEVGQHQKHVGLWNYLVENGYKLGFLFHEAFAPAALAIPLVALPMAWRRNRKVRFATLVFVLFVLIVTLSEVFTNTHYLAPSAGLLVAMVVYGIRYLRAWQRRRRPIGRIVARVVLVMVIVAAGAWFALTYRNTRWHNQRAAILAELRRSPDKHLVIVRYAPGHDVHAEWVFNEANIDEARVVWARDMGPEKNRELIEYFNDRQTWRLEADAQPQQLAIYAEARPPSEAPRTPATTRSSD